MPFDNIRTFSPQRSVSAVCLNIYSLIPRNVYTETKRFGGIKYHRHFKRNVQRDLRSAVANCIVSKDRPIFYRCNSKTTSFQHRKNFLKYGNHIFKTSKLKARQTLKGRKMCGFSTRVITRRNL